MAKMLVYTDHASGHTGRSFTPIPDDVALVLRAKMAAIFAGQRTYQIEEWREPESKAARFASRILRNFEAAFPRPRLPQYPIRRGEIIERRMYGRASLRIDGRCRAAAFAPAARFVCVAIDGVLYARLDVDYMSVPDIPAALTICNERGRLWRLRIAEENGRTLDVTGVIESATVEPNPAGDLELTALSIIVERIG